jgi:hypothetical protein
MASSEGKRGLQMLWRNLKRQEPANLRRVKQLIAEEIQQHCS